MDLRHAVCLPLTILTELGEIRGQSLNLGFGGLAARVGAAAAAPAVDVVVVAQLALPDGTVLCQRGTVRWVKGGRLGVCFDPPGARQLWQLHTLFP